jgi:hypothetical protein
LKVVIVARGSAGKCTGPRAFRSRPTIKTKVNLW